MTYTPYRIMGHIITVVTDSDDVTMCYPHGDIKDRNQATGQVAIAYHPKVIDAPTDEERELFDLLKDTGKVAPIPQDPRGFDVRDSGVARSIDSSKKGREHGIREKMSREAIKPKRKTAEPVDIAGDEAKEDNSE